MLAAQCNKLACKSPPPLADAAVGKGFHPWKKGGNNGSQSASPGPPTPVSREGPPPNFPAYQLESPQSASLLGKMPSETFGLYPRSHPYDSWAFNTAPIKPEASSAGPWWDVHSAGSNGPSGPWGIEASTLHSQLPGNYPGPPEYGLSAPPTSHLIPTGQHLLQDTYKSSMMPSNASSGSSSSSRSQRRYAGRATCDCPNCQEAERLGPAGAHLRKKNIHSCHIPGCEGREDVNHEERAGRPSTLTTDEKINEVEKMILANRRITVREVAEDLNISIGSCHSIFINDLGMRRVAAKFVPKLLNCDQKQHRMNIANEMLDSVRDDPNLLQRVITGDEA
ncbi:hypothetical protein LAZ67_4001717 [Cordylochernes scorpioides]|uniref:Uncharacterized protein n=1 Tax=Cordylochernes scorpioides TaxID=51811 RepID=A0ABY6KGX8_9ARAC|nr:hypothetical protein LAZ67_4001717 [Cordylochernes scorpioides]